MDFSLFGYSERLSDAKSAPGLAILENRLVSAEEVSQGELWKPKQGPPCKILEATVLYRRLVDMRLL